MDDITKDAIASGDRGAINGLVGQVSHGLQLQSLRRIPTAAVRLTCVSLQLQPPWRIPTAAARLTPCCGQLGELIAKQEESDTRRIQSGRGTGQRRVAARLYTARAELHGARP